MSVNERVAKPTHRLLLQSEGSVRRLRGNHHRRDIDWCAVQSDYRAGSLSLREIAEKHGCSHSAIANRAARDAWTRDASLRSDCLPAPPADSGSSRHTDQS